MKSDSCCWGQYHRFWVFILPMKIVPYIQEFELSCRKCVKLAWYETQARSLPVYTWGRQNDMDPTKQGLVRLGRVRKSSHIELIFWCGRFLEVSVQEGSRGHGDKQKKTTERHGFLSCKGVSFVYEWQVVLNYCSLNSLSTLPMRLSRLPS